MSYCLLYYGSWFYLDDDGGFSFDKYDMMRETYWYEPQVYCTFDSLEEAYRFWEEDCEDIVIHDIGEDDDGEDAYVTWYALAKCLGDDEYEILEVSTCNYSKEELDQYR